MGCFELVVDVVPERDLEADQIAKQTRKVFVTGNHVAQLITSRSKELYSQEYDVMV